MKGSSYAIALSGISGEVVAKSSNVAPNGSVLRPASIRFRDSSLSRK